MIKLIFTLITALVLSVSAQDSATIMSILKQDSTVIAFYTNGYKTNVISFKEGKKHGSELFFNQDGTIRYEYKYNLGVLDGIATFYYDSGDIYTKTTYSNGKFVTSTVYNEDGSIAYISKLQNGKCIEVDANNKVIYEQLERIDKYCK